ncbi:MAG: SRPBCC family protein [Polyangiaceae bacterium]
MEEARVSMPSEREVEISRAFKAPKALVYRAYTEASLFRRWCGAHPGWSMPVCEMDVRVGGSFCWRWRNDEDDTEFGFFGVFQQVEPGERIVHTESFDPGGTGFGMGESVVAVTFSEVDGVTHVTTRITYASQQARDSAMQTGMTDGMELSYQLLDGVVSGESSRLEVEQRC